MQIIGREILSADAKIQASKEFITAMSEIEDAIAQVVWPDRSNKFTIFPEKQANGVTPIKTRFVSTLLGRGWEDEQRVEVGVTIKHPGKIDVIKRLPDGRIFAVEWETGNISSSHRALNKMAIGMMRGVLSSGILVLPTRELYNFLTDRIGNYQELEPYFDVWRSINLTGVLGVIAVEHDDTSMSVPKIPKGTDGRALV